jgi:hypothetical protein
MAHLVNAILRGGAVLALLLLAPCARAVTVTQTATYSAAGTGIGSGFFNLGETVTFGAAGPGLVSVVLGYDITGTASSTYPNWLSIPMTITPSFQIMCHHFAGTDSVSYDLGFSGEPITVDAAPTEPAERPQMSYGTSEPTPFHFSRTNTITSPEWLAYFAGTSPGVKTQALMRGDSSYGSTTASATSTLTLTYIYATPDGGQSFAMLAIACVLCAAGHRRIKRSLPTL